MAWEVEDIDDAEKTAATGTADAVLQSVEENHAESVRQEQEVMETLSEAVKRIEEANLWKTLLTLDVFAAGSARPEIVESANKKIRAFARQNLEACVGINQKEVAPKQVVQQVKLPFDTEEMQALKILAAKVLKRDVTKAVLSDYSPTVSQVAAPTQGGTTVNTVQASGQTQAKQPTVNMAPAKKAATAVKKTAKPKPGPGYIPPAKGYIPPTQDGATVSAQGMPAQVNMNSLVSQLINQASGGNVLAQNTGEVSDVNDVNERF